MLLSWMAPIIRDGVNSKCRLLDGVMVVRIVDKILLELDPNTMI